MSAAEAKAFEDVALAAGPAESIPSPFDWDPATWRSLVVARRLRVLEWIAGSGFSLLNVLPNVEATFLAVVAEHGASDKLAVAHQLWRVLEPNVDARIVAIANWELALLWARQDRVVSEVDLSRPLRLSRDALLTSSSRAAIEIHDALPLVAMGEAGPKLLADALAVHADDAPIWVLAADGAVFEVPSSDAAILRQSSVVGLSRETMDTLLEANLLENVG